MEDRFVIHGREERTMSEEKAPLPEQQGLPRLLWGMIVRPRATLGYLRERGGRTWWVPALLAVLLVVLPTVVAAPIATRQAREAVLATQEQWGEQQEGKMSAEEQVQMEQAMSVAASPLITVVFPAVRGAVGLVVVWLVWAGVLHLAGLALGGRSTFGQMVCMVVWTWLPYTLRGLLQTVYILVSSQIIANPGLSGFAQGSHTADELVPASPSLGQIVLRALLRQVDVFLFWNLILLVIGVMVTTHLPRRKAILATLGVWLLLTALGLIPTLVGGLFVQQVGGF
jgi:hypothetical protein